MENIDTLKLVDVAVQPLAEVLVGTLSGSIAEKITRTLLGFVDPNHNQKFLGLATGALVNSFVMYYVARFAFSNILDTSTGLMIFTLVHFANQPTFLSNMFGFSNLVNGKIDTALGLEIGASTNFFSM